MAESYEMPWYNNQEIQETPEPKNTNLVTRLRSKVSKKVVVAAAATAGVLAATAAVIAKSRSGEDSDNSPLSEDFETNPTDLVE